MATYAAADFIDKTLLLTNQAEAWWASPGSTSYPSFNIDAGETTASVYSIVHNGTDVWFEIMDNDRASEQGVPNDTPYFIKYTDGMFDKPALAAQGLQSTTEKAEAEADANKTWSDKLFDTAGTAGKWVLGAAVVTALGVAAIKSRNKNS
jgi:hypothetical protein